MADEHEFGNRITANIEGADDAQSLIEKALTYVKDKHGFVPVDESTLFQGVYYDSRKVGSFITRVKNMEGETAVLKLQLRPLPFDEGFIIRNVEKSLRTDRIRPVRILHDRVWEEDWGFGYLLFEDISRVPALWATVPTTKDDRELHAQFLEAFIESALPIQNAWIPKPSVSIKEKIFEGFDHFYEIAKKSSHKHIDEDELRPFIDTYLSTMRQDDSDIEMRFTHGHLSGLDVKHDVRNGQFIVMANLYWSWRPKYYEMVFPIWVDVMHIRDAFLSFEDFLNRVDAWTDIWPKRVTAEKVFWLMLLERAMMTIMLDLGASEWKEGEVDEKQALLDRWKDFFHWLVKEKLN
ncbi:MAG: hypothetical protein U9Q03_06000 [Patescibacteria group bacterium]|nr:hypothetical protein [Patescibacteria group bacterium]